MIKSCFFSFNVWKESVESISERKHGPKQSCSGEPANSGEEQAASLRSLWARASRHSQLLRPFGNDARRAGGTLERLSTVEEEQRSKALERDGPFSLERRQ